MKGTPEVRFWAKVEKSDGCWNWRGTTTRGYAYFYRAPGFTTVASHFAYFLANGVEVPSGMYVCHTCDNPLCVRPDHLYAGTPKDNTRDMMRKGRFVGNRYSLKTHCKRGHEFTPENTGKTSYPGGRCCRTCQREYNRQWKRSHANFRERA